MRQCSQVQSQAARGKPQTVQTGNPGLAQNLLKPLDMEPAIVDDVLNEGVALTTANPLLRPSNDETRRAAQRDVVEMSHFPFRVGRESRVGLVDGQYRSLERRQSDAMPNNDLYLLDRREALNVSREHFLVDRRDDGSFVVVDRGSACGTIVDGQAIGGHDHGGEAPLRDGSTIRVGTEHSPYCFDFVLSRS